MNRAPFNDLAFNGPFTTLIYVRVPTAFSTAITTSSLAVGFTHIRED